MYITNRQISILKKVLYKLPEEKVSIDKPIKIDRRLINQEDFNKIRDLQYKYFDGEGLELINNIRMQKATYENIFLVGKNKIQFNPVSLSIFIEEHEE